MVISTSWIKELLGRTMLSDHEVVTALERAGIEVEQFIAAKPIDKKVIVGEVKKVVQHPKADRLKLVFVNNGSGEVRVVCGASNVREGLKVALAQVGAVLPDGMEIQAASLRGEMSEGMLCSERELGLGDDHSGILELPEDMEVGISLCDVVKTDGRVEIKTHANRFDLLSMVGLAREVGAMTGAALTEPGRAELTVEAAPEDCVSEEIEAVRYMLARVTVDQHSPSPVEMMDRLRTAGARSLGPVVDVTNYVTLEYGQPLHAFDATKVRLPLTVRRAQAGERLVTLDGVERQLFGEDLVIADQSGPIALAGVMGGAATEVGPQTQEILLEAATFDAAAVRKTAKRHGIRTEASARFERGLPVELAEVGLARAAELLKEVAAGEVEQVVDRLIGKSKKILINIDLSRLTSLLGFTTSVDEVVAALGRLGFEATAEDDLVGVAVPWWRPDVRVWEDVAEEVVRVLGYERVPSTLPYWRPKRLRFDRERAKVRRVRDILYGAGLFEVQTYSFVSEEQLAELGLKSEAHLKLKNPLSSEQAYLRSTILASHLAVLERNRAYAREVGFYEVSGVFIHRGVGEMPDEPQRLAVTMLGERDGYRRVKGVLDVLAEALGVVVTVEPAQHRWWASGRGALIKINNDLIGLIGQLEPGLVRRHKLGGEVAFMEIDIAPLLAAARTRRFAGVGRFPATERDVAVIVPVEVTWAAVERALTNVGLDARFVSDYTGGGLPEGRKSLAVRLRVAHADRTPTEAEAAAAEERAIGVLEREFEARRRR